MYPAGVTGNEAYFNPSTCFECKVCGVETDESEADFMDEELCNKCGKENENV